MATPVVARARERARGGKARTDTAAKRLERALTPYWGAYLKDLAGRSGVEINIVMRAKNGRDINADDYLTLCGAVGIDPFTGKKVKRVERKLEILWWMVGAACVCARVAREEMSVRDLEAHIGVPISSISRIENAQRIGIDALLKVVRFIDLPLDRFTCDPKNAVSQSMQRLKADLEGVGA